MQQYYNCQANRERERKFSSFALITPMYNEMRKPITIATMEKKKPWKQLIESSVESADDTLSLSYKMELSLLMNMWLQSLRRIIKYKLRSARLSQEHANSIVDDPRFVADAHLAYLGSRTFAFIFNSPDRHMHRFVPDLMTFKTASSQQLTDACVVENRIMMTYLLKNGGSYLHHAWTQTCSHNYPSDGDMRAALDFHNGKIEFDAYCRSSLPSQMASQQYRGTNRDIAFSIAQFLHADVKYCDMPKRIRL